MFLVRGLIKSFIQKKLLFVLMKGKIKNFNYIYWKIYMKRFNVFLGLKI